MYYLAIMPLFQSSQANTPVARSDWLNQDVPLFLPSPLYSRMDKPQDYSYKDRPKERAERRQKSLVNHPDTAIIVGELDAWRTGYKSMRLV